MKKIYCPKAERNQFKFNNFWMEDLFDIYIAVLFYCIWFIQHLLNPYYVPWTMPGSWDT